MDTPQIPSAPPVAGQYLDVPGARLYFETIGAGPLLLLIPGANGDANIFMPIKRFLAGQYTVVTYDRRGYSRSELVGPQDLPYKREADADDAQRLLAHLSPEPATVFGTSSGAIVALTLLARHPAAVRTLVPHEPPLLQVLPEAGDFAHFYTDLQATYKAEGMKAVMQKFAAELVSKADAPLMQRERDAAAMKNSVFWFENEASAYPQAHFDMAQLASYADRIVPVGGLESHGTMPYEAVQALAAQLHRPLLELPGGHVSGYVLHPAEFAQGLLAALAKLNH
ncbi:alpha/beta hydrolase [Hymenobacter psoromatis]|uniref:alpha/beta hydrolase n=1 Tax=Hymenobacter psoromatis TaxID=1484116 RepID=UPI001CBF590F|nr:alpha/beta hydrolase [Hymenobacter psoromatis]